MNLMGVFRNGRGEEGGPAGPPYRGQCADAPEEFGCEPARPRNNRVEQASCLFKSGILPDFARTKTPRAFESNGRNQMKPASRVYGLAGISEIRQPRFTQI
jgi:hypothetical protein